MRTGILLINLGTPDSPKPRDVYRYLIEFLTDWRVIDFSWLKRQLLVRGIIVPFRYKNSARSYAHIWTEEGSPLLVWGKKAQHALQDSLGENYIVELAMRYQNPSIEKGLLSLKKQGVDKIIILPLFPQYSSACTGSIYEKVSSIVNTWQTIPSIEYKGSFPTHPQMIEAFAARAKEQEIHTFDHVVMSFHGLPERQLRKGDCHGVCKPSSSCCQVYTKENHTCYGAQSYATAHAIAKALDLKKDDYSISFQSRLGKDPWLRPFTSSVLKELLQKGNKRIAVMCPAFICDCLETLFEIQEEYKEEFLHAGGEELVLIQGLNDHPLWIKALHEILLN